MLDENSEIKEKIERFFSFIALKESKDRNQMTNDQKDGACKILSEILNIEENKISIHAKDNKSQRRPYDEAYAKFRENKISNKKGVIVIRAYGDVNQKMKNFEKNFEKYGKLCGILILITSNNKDNDWKFKRIYHNPEYKEVVENTAIKLRSYIDPKDVIQFEKE